MKRLHVWVMVWCSDSSLKISDSCGKVIGYFQRMASYWFGYPETEVKQPLLNMIEISVELWCKPTKSWDILLSCAQMSLHLYSIEWMLPTIWLPICVNVAMKLTMLTSNLFKISVNTSPHISQIKRITVEHMETGVKFWTHCKY